MVMLRTRASSYLRLTISEPYARRRPSTVANHRDLQSILLDDDIRRGDSCGGGSVVFTWGDDWRGILSLLLVKSNLGLVFFPFGILSAHAGWGAAADFWLNFFALVPLASLLSAVTEELALHTGDLAGGLLNATFGNAVEMILTLQALHAGLLNVVQGALLGSILGNLLLVLGMSFFAGGLFHYMQHFNARGAACSTSLLLLACLAFVAPTVAGNAQPTPASLKDVLVISRITALLVAVTYCLFLYFQLYTHLSFFKHSTDLLAEDGTPPRCCCEAAAALDEEDDAGWPPAVSKFTAIGLLALVTAAVTACSAIVVNSIEGVTVRCGLPKSFISVVLLPIVGNAAEHVTAVTVAMKNKPDLTIGVAIGSSTQIALFMVPFSVLAGWLMGQPMTLALSYVGAAVLLFSVLIVIGVVQDGTTNWFEGTMLMAAYAVVAVVFWFRDPAGPLLTAVPPAVTATAVAATSPV